MTRIKFLATLAGILFHLNVVAQCDDLWNRTDSAEVVNYYIPEFESPDTFDGLWESTSGAVFMVRKAPDNECNASYQMIMIKDIVLANDWHIRVKTGSVIGLLFPTVDTKTFSCKYRRRKLDTVRVYHLSLRGGKLALSNISGSRRKLFAVKLKPNSDFSQNNIETVSNTQHTSPLSKGKIAREK